jgi:hypothetical protein
VPRWRQLHLSGYQPTNAQANNSNRSPLKAAVGIKSRHSNNGRPCRASLRVLEAALFAPVRKELAEIGAAL